jgi:streptogramin lyase
MLGRTLRTTILAALLALAAVSPAVAAPAVSGEFPLQTELNANNKIVEGPDGNMWVTLNGPKDVAKITPAGAVTEYDLGIEGASGITVAAGEVWVSRNGGVTQFKPGDPEGTKVSTPVEPVVSDPIVFAPDGNIWAAANEKLVRIPLADPTKFKAFPVAGLGPRDIDVAGSLLVVADFGTPRVLAATIADPPVTTELPLKGGSQGVAGNAAGQIAFSQQGQMPTEFGLLTPPGPALFTQSPATDPFGIALGPDAAFWIAQFNVDTVTRLGTNDVATTISPGFAKGSGPRQIAAGPGNTLWVTLQNAKKIGRISGVENSPPPPPPPPKVPQTKIEKGPKGKKGTTRKLGKAKFKFSSTDPTAGFECRLLKLTKPGRKAQGSAKPKQKSRATPFKPCKSPKAYWLPVGRYRFEVRAVNAAGADPTPAKSSFHVVRILPKRTSH